jgi:hypothetical protein
MATSFNKTYSITLKFTYEGGAAIAEDDMNVEVLRTQIQEWITSKVGSIQKGDISVHIVGTVSET